MNKSTMIVNSRTLLTKIAHLEKLNFEEMSISGDKATNSLMLWGTKILDCEISSSFDFYLYKNKAVKLIAHLKLINEQPITITFEESEVFNIHIRGFYV